MSEFGAEAKFGNHGAINQRWTEEQQVDVFEHQFVMLSKIPQLRGITPWVLMDFRSTTRNIPKLQDGFNRKGLFSEDGKKSRPSCIFKKSIKRIRQQRPISVELRRGTANPLRRCPYL